jgi:hypothetical protein
MKEAQPGSAALFLGAFKKLRKATISFVMSICPSVCPTVRLSVCMEQIGSYKPEFHEN